MSESENHRSTYMCTQYDTCSNLPIVTAGDDTGVLKMIGSECMSESETSRIDIIYIYGTIWHMFKLTHSNCR